MFDLQRFDDSDTQVTPAYGLISAADKAKLESGGFCSVSVNGAFAYFYKTPTPTGTPDYTLRLIDGALPAIDATAFGSNVELTATNGNETIRGTYIDSNTWDRIEVTSYGRWTITGGGVSKVWDVNTLRYYSNFDTLAAE